MTESLSGRQFVFGYGSLAAGPRLGGLAPAAPRPEGFVAELRRAARGWGVAMDNRRDLPGYKYYVDADGRRPAAFVCFLDVIRADAGASVNGLCLPVGARELAVLDRRERNYDRVEVSDRVQAHGARVWAYVGSRAGRARFEHGRRSGRAVISAGYLRAVEGAFRALGTAAYEACRPSLDPRGIPVTELTLARIGPGRPAGGPR